MGTTEKILALSNAVAKSLGDGWTVDPHRANEWGAPLAHTDGRVLWLNVDWTTASKYEVSPQYPKRPDSNDEFKPKQTPKSIGGSVSKGGDAIARDILRRLMPEYVVAFTEGMRMLSASQDAAFNRTLAAARLVAANPDVRIDTHRDDSVSWSPKGPGHGHVQIYHGGEGGFIELHSLTLAEIEAILAVVKRD